MGGLVGTLAGSAATTVGWMAFVVIVSFFILLESGGLRNRIIQIISLYMPSRCAPLEPETGTELECIPARADHHLLFEGHHIYDLDDRPGGSLRHPSGFDRRARRLPARDRPAINWTVLGLVTFFQGSNPFGLAPLTYAHHRDRGCP